MNAKPCVPWRQPFIDPPSVQASRRGAAFERGDASCMFVSLDLKRRIPEGEDSIANEFIDCSVGLDDQGSEFLEILRHVSHEAIRRHALGYRREILDVGEHNTDAAGLASHHDFSL